MNPVKLRNIAKILLIILPLANSLAVDMYLPAYANIASDFVVPEGWINYSMGIYLLGLAIAQMIYGPVSDNIGRRKPLLIGSVIFVIASLACAVASHFTTFMLARFLQAVGACSALVLTRAIIADSFSHDKQVRLLALVSAANIFSPALGPLLGSLLLTAMSWRMIFVAIFAYSLVTTLLAYWYIPETNSEPDPQATEKRVLWANSVMLLTNSFYMRYVACVGLIFSLCFVWVTLSPAVVIHDLHIPQLYFGFFFFMQCLGNTFGSLLPAYYCSEKADRRIQRLGFAVMLATTITLLMLYQSQYINPYDVAIVIVVLYFTAGAVQPGVIARAMEIFPKHKGLAAGWLGLIQTTMGMITTCLTALFYQHSLTAMVYLLFIMSALCAVLMWTAARGQARQQGSLTMSA